MSFSLKNKRVISLLVCFLLLSAIVMVPCTNAHAVNITPLTINSCTQLSDGRVAVNYTMSRSTYLYESVSLGWNYPAAWGLQGDVRYFTQQGSGTIYLNSPSTYAFTQNIMSKYQVANSYSESACVASYNIVPSGTVTTFHTVTQAEEAVAKISILVGGLVCTFAPQTKAIKIFGGILLAYSVIDTVSDVLNVSGWGLPETGQYYKVSVWFSGNMRYQYFGVWDNALDYSQGEMPTFYNYSSWPIASGN